MLFFLCCEGYGREAKALGVGHIDAYRVFSDIFNGYGRSAKC